MYIITLFIYLIITIINNKEISGILKLVKNFVIVNQSSYKMKQKNLVLVILIPTIKIVLMNLQYSLKMKVGLFVL